MRPVSNRDMIQHVGAKYYKLYFKLVDFALKSNNATAVVTASTFPESRYSNYQYVDGYSSCTVVIPNLCHCYYQSGRLYAQIHVAKLLPPKCNRSYRCRTHSITGSLHSRECREPCSPSVHLIYLIKYLLIRSSDYPRTLREWGRRLEANLAQDMVVKDYPGLRDPSDYAAFKRKWQYLFAYAGAGFSKGYITCHMLTFIREVSFHKISTQIPVPMLIIFSFQDDTPILRCG